MVVLLVEVNKLRVLQVSDELRLASRIELVLRFLKEVLVKSVHESVVRVAHGTFHFVVDDTLIAEA